MSSLPPSSTGKTTISILLSKTTSHASKSGDPHYGQRIAVVVWAGRHAAAAPVGDGDKRGRSLLTYYHFWDHPRQWTHLDGLLTRLAPVSAVHVAHADYNAKVANGKGKGNEAASVRAAQVRKVLDNLCRMLSGRTDLTEQTNAAARDGSAAAPDTSSLVRVHSSGVPNADPNRLRTLLQQMLVSDDDGGSALNRAEVRVAGDVELVHHPLISRGLALYLSAEGLWQGGVGPSLDEDHAGRYEIDAGVLDSHLVLDRTAATAIHLWPPANAGQAVVTGGRPQTNSLSGLVGQHVSTAQGRRLLETWLRQPLVQLEPLLHRQEAVAVLVQEGVGRDAIKDEGLRPMAGLDWTKLAVQLGRYAGQDDLDDNQEEDDEAAAVAASGNNDGLTTAGNRRALHSLYQLYLIASQKLPNLREQLQNVVQEIGDNFLLSQVLDGLSQAEQNLRRSVELAEAVLDLDQAPRELLVRDSYAEELGDIRRELRELQDELDDCLADMNELWAEECGSGNPATVRLEVSGEGSDLQMQFRLPNANDTKILQEKLGSTIRVHRLLKNGVYFSTKELRELASKKGDLTAEYDRRQRQVVLPAMKVAATYQHVLEQASDWVATLDVLVALAHLAAYSPHGYCRPVLTDGDADGLGIVLKGARHPCVELQDNMEYISNDVQLVFGESSFLLVTGPNMGGKSTYIRALGAIVVLAQIGSYVPCSAAQINLCHHILARVGAGDLQERGISTFMAEMLESSSILRKATKRSLIIIDELGRGTSTFDGYGLARAISEYMVRRIGCFTVFATHFHELTALEDSEPSVKNCHVTAARGDHGLTFLYEVKPGPCLESFGIQVAEMAHVPAVVIQDAKRRAKELENFEYGNRSKKRLAAGTTSAMEVEPANERDASDVAAGDMDFVNRFRRLPLDSILAEGYPSEEAKKNSILQLLEAI